MRTTNFQRVADALPAGSEKRSPSHLAAVVRFWKKCNERIERIEESIGKSEYVVPAATIGVAIIAEHLNND
jgi:hypothetical protein